MINYAAILSKHEIPMEEIVKELNKRGWDVFGKELQDVEEIPTDVSVWMLFRWETFGYPHFPIKGYVRIVAQEGKNDKRAYFHVVQSSWSIIVYYTIIHAVQFRYKLIKKALR